MRFGFVGQQFDQGPSQPERLRRQLTPTAVALVENQIDGRQDGGQPLRKEVTGRHPERNGGRLDLALGPHQSLRHRLFRHQKGPGDFVGGEATEGAQRQGHLSLDGERRVTAGEDELQALIRKTHSWHGALRGGLALQEDRLGRQGLVAANAVDGTVARRGQQPGPSVVGIPIAGPALGGDGEGLLSGLLGEIEVTEEADQGSDDAAPFVSERLLEDCYHSMVGRTSMAPPSLAAGILAASSMAASRSSAS